MVELPGFAVPPISISRIRPGRARPDDPLGRPGDRRADRPRRAAPRSSLRGPLGRGWPIEAAVGRDVVIVAGGIGLAPLRPLIDAILADRPRFGAVRLYLGARTPRDRLFVAEMNALAGRADLEVAEIVDRAGPEWLGRVGIVTQLFDQATWDGSRATAFMCGPERMMQATASDARAPRRRPGRHLADPRAEHGLRRRHLRPLPARPVLRLPRRTGLLAGRARHAHSVGRDCDDRTAADRARTPLAAGDRAPRRPRIGVVKFASCDGCQLTLLDLEDELLAIAEQVDIVEFAEATSRRSAGPFDVLFVEGSISTPEQVEEIARLRAVTQRLVTIGACATAGGIQAIRNWFDHDEVRAAVYPEPGYVESLAMARPVADFVAVDAELRGCPISPAQLREFLVALVTGRRAAAPRRGRLPRMQAARRRLRRRRPRHPVPRPGDPDRLRRDLPGLRPRLLRLLRPARIGEHEPRSRPGCRMAAAPPRSAACSPASPPGPEPFRAVIDAHGGPPGPGTPAPETTDA